jgi:UDP-2-acetamido-3-amino-2,3-dideoxy-glucuronate N-acetyltransferase
MEKIIHKNISVIGCGYWGKNLVRNFYDLGALRSICDSNEETLKQLEITYPSVKRETDFSAVLSDNEIEGVVISVPAALHYQMTRQALLAGKNVFVEKPLALSVIEGLELVRLADEKKKILMVGHLLEYHPAVVKLKELVDRGELGKVYYIYSSRLNLGKFRTEENILWSFAPHDIAIILLLLGQMPYEASTFGGCYLNQEVADITITHMNFKSGAKAHIFVSWLHPYKEQKLVVVGDKRMAVFDDMEPKDKLLLYDHQVEWVKQVPTPEKADAKPVELHMAEPLRLECQHFLDCLESNTKPKTDGENGLRVLRVLDASQKSLQSAGVFIPLDSREFYIHPTSILEEPVTIGEGTKIWHFCHVMPYATIGNNCILGQNTFVASNVSIGNNVKIENNVSLFEGVTLEDDVFCGPSCVFTNVVTPRSFISQKGKYAMTLVKKGTTIGANSTIVCGHTIGKYAFIGAGSVVTKDIPDYALIYGNPAQIQGWLCECGARLDFTKDSIANCDSCGKAYIKQEVTGEMKIERSSP